MTTWPWLLALALLSLLAGVLTGWGLLQHLAYVLFGLDLIGLSVVLAGRRGLKVTGTTNRVRMTAGEEVEEIYEVSKESILPGIWLELDDGSGEHVSFGLSGRASDTIIRRQIIEGRGRHEVAGGVLRIRDPFGLFAITHQQLEGVAILAYPRPLRTREAVAAASASVSSSSRWRPIDTDATLGDLRTYQPGDPPARIHWRSTARRGTLMVTDPENSPGRSLWLLVDLGGGEEQAEIAAGIAAYLVEVLSQAGQEIGAVIAGERTVTAPPRRGRDHAARLLEMLSTVGPALRPQSDLLLAAGTQCGHAGSFLWVSSAANPDPYLRRLQTICPTVRFIPATAPDEEAAEAS